MEDNDRIKEKAAEIERLIAAGQLDDALKRTRRLLQKFPGNTTLLFLLGVIAGARNDFASASKLLGSLCDSGKADFRTHLLMCRALEQIDVTAACNRYLTELRSERWGQEQFDALNVAYLSLLGASGQYSEISAFVDSTPNLKVSAEIDLLIARGVEAVHGVGSAIAHFERSAYTPTSALHRFNLGTLYEKSLRLDAAMHNYKLALELDPLLDDAAYNLGILDLCHGDFDRGWRHYSRRWGATGFKSRLAVGACKSGPSLTIRSSCEFIGRHVELLPEQGIGEQLLFLTCINELGLLAASVSLTLDPRLMSALRLIPRFQEWVGSASRRGFPCDLSIPLGVLPEVFRRDQSRFPRESSILPFERGDPLASMQSTVSGCQRLGLCLSSSSARFGERKSMTPKTAEQFFPELGRVKQLVNLDHTVERASELDELRKVFPNLIFPEGLDGAQGLDRLVQEILTCDAVVTVSCTVAHFAGVLGVPCFVVVNDWVLSKYWYWNHISGNGASLWYPSLRIVMRKELPFRELFSPTSDARQRPSAEGR